MHEQYLAAEVLVPLAVALRGPKAAPAAGYLRFSMEELQAILEASVYGSDECEHAWQY